MEVKCSVCGKIIDRPVRQVNESNKKGWKIYCSNECRSIAKKIKCTCAYCGKEILKTPSEIKRSKYGNVFCNKSCACSYNNSHFRTKENNPNWKGGRLGSNTYLTYAYRAYQPSCAVCGIEDKDVLQVHHIDLNHDNNDIDNLIFLCANCHSKVHRGGLEITEDIKKNRKKK